MHSHRRRPYSPDELRAFGLDRLMEELFDAHYRVGGKRGEAFDSRHHAIISVMAQHLAQIWECLNEKQVRKEDSRYDPE